MRRPIADRSCRSPLRPASNLTRPRTCHLTPAGCPQAGEPGPGLRYRHLPRRCRGRRRRHSRLILKGTLAQHLSCGQRIAGKPADRPITPSQPRVRRDCWRPGARWPGSGQQWAGPCRAHRTAARVARPSAGRPRYPVTDGDAPAVFGRTPGARVVTRRRLPTRCAGRRLSHPLLRGQSPGPLLEVV
jgi:hypothetical protein